MINFLLININIIFSPVCDCVEIAAVICGNYGMETVALMGDKKRNQSVVTYADLQIQWPS